MRLKKELLGILGFTFIFTIIAFCIHLYFILSNNDFYGPSSDASWQFIPYQLTLLSEYKDGNIFWSWKSGLGGDLWGQLSYYYSTNFLMLFLFFIKDPSYTELINYRLPISIVKSIFVMISMYIYLRFNGLRYIFAFIGSIIYVGSLIYINKSYLFDYMNDPMIYLPLLLLSVDFYLRKNCKVPFIIMVALMCFINFYFAYISTIVLGLYILTKVGSSRDSWKVNGSKLINLTYYYLIGLFISCISFIPAFFAYRGADRFGNEYLSVPILFEKEFYIGMFYRLFVADDPAYRLSYYQFGFPIAVLFLVGIGLFTFWKERKDVRNFLLILLLLYITPLTYSMFNGFSFPYARWYYALTFAIAAYSAMVLQQLYDSNKNSKKITVILVFISVFFISIRTYIFKEPQTNYGYLLIIGCVLTGVFFYFKSNSNRNAVLLLLIFSIIINVVVNNVVYSGTTIAKDLKQGMADPKLKTYPAFDNIELNGVLDDIKNTEDFQRIIIDSATYNSPMIQDYYGTSTYHSLVDKYIHQFIKKDIGVYHGTDIPSLYQDFDNRIYLETLFNVEYKVAWSGKHTYISPIYEEEFVSENSSYKVYKNPYAVNIGMIFDTYILEREFDKLPFAEKEQLMTKTLVVPDDSETKLKSFSTDEWLNQKNSSILEDFTFKDISSSGQDIVDVASNGTISKTFNYQPNAEYLLEFTLKNTNPLESTKIDVNGKVINKRRADDAYAYPVFDYAVNVSDVVQSGKLEIKLQQGKYVLKNLRLSVYPEEQVRKDLELLKKREVKNIKVTNRTISATVDVEKEGTHMFLSVPYSRGWEAFVNGEKVNVLRTNKAFMSIPLQKGNNEIVLEYITPGFKLGGLLSCLGLILLIILIVRGRRKGNKED